MTRPGEALRLALRDCYANSWRLVPVNALLGLLLAAVTAAAVARPALAVLAVAAGPVAAALVHCAVTLVRTGSLTFADAVEGLRLHWRRGLRLAALGTGFAVVGLVALRFYGSSPLAFVALYLILALGLLQVVLWTLAIAEPERPLRRCARDAAELAARRPGATALVGLALLLVNAAGLAAGLMPFLTLTIAYSFVAAAHFALPPSTPEDAS